MKNVFKVLGIIAIAAVIGFSMVSCGGGDGDDGEGNALFEGIWKGNYNFYSGEKPFTITISGDSFTLKSDDSAFADENKNLKLKNAERDDLYDSWHRGFVDYVGYLEIHEKDKTKLTFHDFPAIFEFTKQ